MAGARVILGDDLDPLAILRALGVEDAWAVEPVAGGWDTALWRVDRGGGSSALRLFRPEQASTARREALVLRALAGQVPVPELQAEGTWRGRPVLLLSWVPGRTLAHALRACPWLAWRLGRAFGRVQAQIHAVPVTEPLRQVVTDWIAWAGPGEEALQARLRAFPLRADALLHLDYHPLNVMVEGAEVTGVLDWANVSVGDPRADLARTLSILRLAPPPTGALERLYALIARLLELGWRSGYGKQASAQEEMALFYAWAGAVMLRDLAPKVGRPGVWLRQHHLDAVRRWTEAWKRRAGLALSL